MAAVISFHSGEDRLVKAAFRDGLRAGVYEAASDDPMRPDVRGERGEPAVAVGETAVGTEGD